MRFVLSYFITHTSTLARAHASDRHRICSSPGPIEAGLPCEGRIMIVFCFESFERNPPRIRAKNQKKQKTSEIFSVGKEEVS